MKLLMTLADLNGNRPGVQRRCEIEKKRTQEGGPWRRMRILYVSPEVHNLKLERNWPVVSPCSGRPQFVECPSRVSEVGSPVQREGTPSEKLHAKC